MGCSDGAHSSVHTPRLDGRSLYGAAESLLEVDLRAHDHRRLGAEAAIVQAGCEDDVALRNHGPVGTTHDCAIVLPVDVNGDVVERSRQFARRGCAGLVGALLDLAHDRDRLFDRCIGGVLAVALLRQNRSVVHARGHQSGKTTGNRSNHHHEPDGHHQ